MKQIVVVVAVLGGVAAAYGTNATRQQTPLVVHEWGTLTTRHGPNGMPQGRLNRINASEVLGRIDLLRND